MTLKVPSLIKSALANGLLFVLFASLTGCMLPNNNRNDPFNNDPYWNDRDASFERERIRRERRELERDRVQLEEKEYELDRRRRELQRPAPTVTPPPPPPPPAERCPRGFEPSERKCSKEERRRGCQDMRLPGGLGCVRR